MLVDTDIWYLFAGILLLGGICVPQIRKKMSFIGSILYIYLIVLIGVTFFPFEIGLTPEEISWYIHISGKNNYIPFASIYEIISQEYLDWSMKVRQIFGNFILLSPLGFLLPFIYTKHSMRFMFVVILFMSVGIELCQFFANILIGYNYRVVDIDDVILNTLGGMLGYVGYIVYDKYIFPDKKTT